MGFYKRVWRFDDANSLHAYLKDSIRRIQAGTLDLKGDFAEIYDTLEVAYKLDEYEYDECCFKSTLYSLATSAGLRSTPYLFSLVERMHFRSKKKQEALDRATGKKILAEIAGGSVKESGKSLTEKLIFGSSNFTNGCISLNYSDIYDYSQDKCISKWLKIVGDLVIRNVYFNDPVTVVIWNDGTKTIVRAENEAYDPEKGLAMAICKKVMGNKGNYYETFKTWLPKKPDNA
jgi:hypothetical protein